MDAPTSKASSSSPKPIVETMPWLRLTGSDLQARSDKASPENAEALLAEARQLLVTLKVDRSRVESRLAEFGLDDPIEVVKGRSALDEAIESCQQAIERLDQLAETARNG